MTELVQRYVGMPATGEALDLTGPSDDLASAWDRIRDLERQCRDARDAISDEFLGRMDREAAWTMHVPGFKVTAPSPAPEVEADVVQLRVVLDDLVTRGLITDEAATAALEPVITFKARKAGIKALQKIPGEVGQRVAECCHQVEKTRRVTVKPERT